MYLITKMTEQKIETAEDIISALMNDVDSVKDQIKDQEYLDIVNKISKIKELTPRFVKVYYIEQYIHTDDNEDDEDDEEKNTIVPRYMEGYYKVINNPQCFADCHDNTISKSYLEWDFTKKPQISQSSNGRCLCVIYKIDLKSQFILSLF